MAEHEVKCEYKSIPCVDPNCEKEGVPLRGLVEHLKAEHDATQLVCNDGVTTMPLPLLHSTLPNVRDIFILCPKKLIILVENPSPVQGIFSRYPEVPGDGF